LSGLLLVAERLDVGYGPTREHDRPTEVTAAFHLAVLGFEIAVFVDICDFAPCQQIEVTGIAGWVL
jgi:hypothetical protein